MNDDVNRTTGNPEEQQTPRVQPKRTNVGWPIAMTVIVLALLAFAVYVIEQRKKQKKAEFVLNGPDVAVELGKVAETILKSVISSPAGSGADVAQSAGGTSMSPAGKPTAADLALRLAVFVGAGIMEDYLHKNPEVSEIAAAVLSELAEGRTVPDESTGDTEAQPGEALETPATRALDAAAKGLEARYRRDGKTSLETAAAILTSVSEKLRDLKGDVDPNTAAGVCQSVAEFLLWSRERTDSAGRTAEPETDPSGEARLVAAKVLEIVSRELAKGNATDAAGIVKQVEELLRQ